MEQTNPKPFVFVLMPFSVEFTDIYEVGIKQACKDAGAYCERVDEQVFVENILERIYNQIAKSDIIVADMTGRNPNVFYETGYAHALNKQVILLTQNADDIPFDLKHYPHIVYSGKIAWLKSQLEKKISWCVNNPKNSLASVDLNIQLYIRGVPLIDKPVIEYSRYVYFTIDIHNLTNKVLDANSLGLALVAPEKLVFNSQIGSSVQLPDGRQNYNLLVPHNLFPGGWNSLEVSFQEPLKTKKMELLLRLFTELGPKEYTLTIES